MENETPKLTVYLAGPIDGCTTEECTDWRERVKEELQDINFLDPLRRDFKQKDTGDTVWADEKYIADIVESDKDDVASSDVVLVYHDRPSVGTSMEILYAFERGIFVLTVGATEKPLSPWILYHSSKIVDNLDDAIEELKKISEQYLTHEVTEWEDDM